MSLWKTSPTRRANRASAGKISMQVKGLLGCAALVAGALAGSPGVRAQTVPPLAVSINARAYAALIPGSAIAVEVDNDTDQAQRLKADISAALVARGYRVQPGAQLVLAFYATEPDEHARESALSRRLDGFQSSPVGPAGGTFDNFHRNDQQIRTGVVTTITDRIFGHRSQQTAAATEQPAEARAVHVSMDLNERSGRRRVWQASAGTMTDRADSYEVTSELVPALIERLGINAVEQVSLP